MVSKSSHFKYLKPNDAKKLQFWIFFNGKMASCFPSFLTTFSLGLGFSWAVNGDRLVGHIHYRAVGSSLKLNKRIVL